MIRLTFPNPNNNQIQLEPGTYTIVPQLNQDIFSEVLVDYIDDNLSFTAASGEVRVGISKPTQISGRIVDAEFSLLRSMCNGTFDAIP